jgi:hypothetical protein
MPSSDKTKEVLEQILAELYAEEAKDTQINDGSYLVAEDGQLLGKINTNPYDTESILNEYGPFGSQYSATSIFNEYSQYGSQYGFYSINNPYCTQPPKLYINGRLLGLVSANSHVPNRISPEAFLYTLRNDLNDLLQGRLIESESHARQLSGDSYIEAADGTFLGSLNPNKFDTESIFNQFGSYGNKFSQVSILNKFSDYGNQFSQLSPFNKFSNTPPKIFLKGNFYAYLTVNTMLRPNIQPDEIFEWAQKNVRKSYG